MKITFLTTGHGQPYLPVSTITKLGHEVRSFNPYYKVPHFDMSTAQKIEALYQKKDADYHRMLDKFLEECSDSDIVVCPLNPFHPEWLLKQLPNTIKVLGLVDDPVIFYTATVGFLFAFDAAFYVSPSFSQDFSTADILELNGIKQHTWFPLSLISKNELGTDIFQTIDLRTKAAIYVGGLYYEKLERLSSIKRSLGTEFTIAGRWPKYGWAGLTAALKNKCTWFPHRVLPLSDIERTAAYKQYKIGFNLHLNEKRETGNMRCYETTAHGLMLISNKSAMDLHTEMYKPNVEAVYYESVEEAVELVKFYLKNDRARIKIARAGHQRFLDDYSNENIVQRFIQWCLCLKKKLDYEHISN